MKVIKSDVKTKLGAVSRAVHIREGKPIDFYYSISNHNWWNFKARLWVRRRMKAFKKEEMSHGALEGPRNLHA
jgi:hypothetical protein